MWLLFVVAALPFGILANRIHHHLAPDAIAPSDLYRQARQRHERVHEIRIRFAPDERMHASHRSAHDKPQMIHAQPFVDEPVVCGNHVVVIVLGKMRVQAVTGLG